VVPVYRANGQNQTPSLPIFSPPQMALKAAVSVTPLLPSPPLRRLLLSPSPSSAAARRIARVSAAMATTEVHPAVVVGGGRVGQALVSMGPPGGDVLVGRGEKVPDDAPGPILVCTRNDDLDAVLEATPKSRWRGTCSPTPPTSSSCPLLSRLMCFGWALAFACRSSYSFCAAACVRSGLFMRVFPSALHFRQIVPEN
jgi:hypothetical protein